MPTAILVDGSYFIKRYRKVSSSPTHYDPKIVVKDLFTWCLKDLDDKDAGRRELYRIFFYDCPPLMKKAHNPVSKKPLDFSKTKEASFRLELHAQLKKQRKVALRLGRLSDHAHWAIKPEITKNLLSGKIQIADLSDDDVHYDVRQKGVERVPRVRACRPLVQTQSSFGRQEEALKGRASASRDVSRPLRQYLHSMPPKSR